MKVLEQEIYIVINNAVNLYKNNLLDGINNPFDKITWFSNKE